MVSPSWLCLWYVLSFVAALGLSRGRAGRFAILLLLFCFISSCISLALLTGLFF